MCWLHIRLPLHVSVPWTGSFILFPCSEFRPKALFLLNEVITNNSSSSWSDPNSVLYNLLFTLRRHHSGGHPWLGVFGAVRCLLRCGNCDTFSALKCRWEPAASCIKPLLPSHWWNTDSKVAVWNLGPTTTTIAKNTFFNPSNCSSSFSCWVSEWNLLKSLFFSFCFWKWSFFLCERWPSLSASCFCQVWPL